MLREYLWYKKSKIKSILSFVHRLNRLKCTNYSYKFMNDSSWYTFLHGHTYSIYFKFHAISASCSLQFVPNFVEPLHCFESFPNSIDCIGCMHRCTPVRRQVVPAISKIAVITYCRMGNTHTVKYNRFSICGVSSRWCCFKRNWKKNYFSGNYRLWCRW